MATPIEIETLFVAPVSAAFTTPPGADPEAFFDVLGDHLAQFTPYQLGAAARSLQASRAMRSFPTIAECVAECGKRPAHPVAVLPASKGVVDEDGRYLSGYEARKAQEAAESRAAAERLCNSPMGIEAAYDRWLPALIEFVMERQRLPGSQEVPRLKAISRRADEATRRFAVLRPLREAMHATCERRVFGKELERQGAAAE